MIYGAPLANLLKHNWQETFLYLGYIGLILLIFEGGLSTRIDLLKANFTLSVVCATTGVLCPISLSYLLLHWGFGYGAVETFIIGAALSATSLGTTFAVIASASNSLGLNLTQTRIGAVLVSAAVIDDVTGLVMSSVIHGLGKLSRGDKLSRGENVSLGWLIGRPIVASAGMAILTPVLTKWFFAPLFRKFVEDSFSRYNHLSNITLMILVLSAFISAAAYTGTSILFGAFLAGTFLTYIPSKGPSRAQGERKRDKSPTFVHTFERYCLDAYQFVLGPLFFASIGSAIPFLDLWTREAIWRGLVYSLLMLIGKFVVGMWIPIWSVTQHDPRKAKEKENLQQQQPTAKAGHPLETTTSSHHSPSHSTALGSSLSPALLLGMAMVARGEIGLLIVEIGYNSTSYVSPQGFTTAIWAILLNTIIGPVCAGMWIKFRGAPIKEGPWGLMPGPDHAVEEEIEMRGGDSGWLGTQTEGDPLGRIEAGQ